MIFIVSPGTVLFAFIKNTDPHVSLSEGFEEKARHRRRRPLRTIDLSSRQGIFQIVPKNMTGIALFEILRVGRASKRGETAVDTSI